MKGTVLERLEAKIERITETGCWVFTGTSTAGGYGVMWENGKRMYAHRASYEEFNGAIPGDLEIDHLCRVTSCVNPAHLEAVTHKENTIRGRQGKWQKKKTYCKHGHEFSEGNTVIRNRGGAICRECRTCRNQRNVEYRKSLKLKEKYYAA